MAKSTKCSESSKPKKPYPDFPLFAHATRRWAKKIRGKLHDFGPWEDRDAALQKYLDEKDELHAGRTPRKGGDGLTIRELWNRFLTAKGRLVDTRELSDRMIANYDSACEKIIGAFGRNRLVTDLAAANEVRASMGADRREGKLNRRSGKRVRQVAPPSRSEAPGSEFLRHPPHVSDNRW